MPLPYVGARRFLGAKVGRTCVELGALRQRVAAMTQLVEEDVAFLDEQQRFELFEAQCLGRLCFGGGPFCVTGGAFVAGGDVLTVGAWVPGVGFDGRL